MNTNMSVFSARLALLAGGDFGMRDAGCGMCADKREPIVWRGRGRGRRGRRGRGCDGDAQGKKGKEGTCIFAGLGMWLETKGVMNPGQWWFTSAFDFGFRQGRGLLTYSLH